jgi:peptidoglycan/xylan/chitin deacetylase (PgdA/CDA1 family)
MEAASPPASPNEDAVLFTVDVEPDWGFTGSRAVREHLPRLLDLLDEWRAPATFFVAALMLDDCLPALRRIGPGHEVASHGLTHRKIGSLPPEERRRELVESRALLEDALGRPVLGMRAPFFSRPASWLDEVAAAGYAYDASDGVIRPSLGNLRHRRRKPVDRRGPVPSLPVSTFADGLCPFALTWLRLLDPVAPLLLPRRPRVFYLHLHEFLPRATAGALRPALRPVLTRNCGERAWGLLRRALAPHAARFATCAAYLGLDAPAEVR